MNNYFTLDVVILSSLAFGVAFTILISIIKDFFPKKTWWTHVTCGMCLQEFETETKFHGHACNRLKRSYDHSYPLKLAKADPNPAFEKEIVDLEELETLDVNKMLEELHEAAVNDMVDIKRANNTIKSQKILIDELKERESKLEDFTGRHPIENYFELMGREAEVAEYKEHFRRAECQLKHTSECRDVWKAALSELNKCEEHDHMASATMAYSDAAKEVEKLRADYKE